MLGASAEEIQITTGASEALHVLAAWASERGGNVVLPAPCFPPMRALPSALGLEVRSYRLRRENGFALDLDEVKALLDDDTRYVLVNTPHNPTGAVLSASELAALHELTSSRGIPLLSDEVYTPIADGGLPPSASRLPGAVVVGDLSKALCLPGVRIGFILDRDARRRAYLLNARETFTVSNGPLDEAIAALAVRNRDVFYAKARETVRTNLPVLDDLLARRGDLFASVRPRGGMTAFPWLADNRDARALCLELANNGVLIVPGDCFDAPAHARIGFGATPPADFARGIARLDEILAARVAA
jgi:aspartate/methionine/tyrosine aminotransferase